MPVQAAHVGLTGSEPKPLAQAVRQDRVGADETVRLDVIVRRRKLADEKSDAILTSLASDRRRHLTREEFREHFGADPAELARVAETLGAYGLRATESDPARRTVRFTGPARAVNDAFKIALARYALPGKAAYRSHAGSLQIPAAIADLVEAVFGLDQSPRVQPLVRLILPPAAGRHPVMPPHPLTPLQVATDYSFPPFTTGAGQTIALVELGGGFLASDNAATFATLGPAAPTPTVIVASGTNSPSADPTNRADQEVAMDIQIAGSCAPGATIALYFATDSSESEGTFIATVQTAVHDSVNNPSVISVSWGWPEEHFSAMAMQTMEDVFIDAAVMGITVCAASGDHGATGTDPPDGKGRVVFPASAPHALACGGTELAPPAETAWNEGAVPKGGATGGGISTAFAVPYYQVGMSMPPSINPGDGPGRGVPDVAGNAAAATGYRVTFHGFSTSASGTSTVAPLWAALIARLNEVLGHRLGFVNPMLYQLRGTPAFRDITVGNNDIAGSGAGYKAGAGWDCCTGMGSPVGTELLKALTFSKLSQFFAPNQITCGYAQDATLYLDKPDTVPITVAVTSDNPNVVKVVSPVTILPGNVSCPVTCTAPAVAGPFVPKFVEVHATYAGTTLTMTAEVVPPRVVSVALAPSTVLNGGSSQCTVSLDRASLKGKVTVELFCSAPGYASVPPTLQIDETDDHNRFTVTTPAIASPFPPAHATILAIYRASPTDPGTSASAVLTVEPNVVPGMVKSLALTPATVTEGGLSTGLVTLIQPVPTDTVVGLTARDLLANGTPTPPVLGGGSTIVSLPVPPAVTVYAGHTQAQFTIKTKPNSVAAGSIRRVQISAVTGFLPAIATLTVQH